MNTKKLFFTLTLFLFIIQGYAQDSSKIVKNRLYPVVIGSNAIYVGSLIYLSSVWYKKDDHTSFHFYNDLPQWKQMDKIGHFTTSFVESEAIARTLVWCGVPDRKAHILGFAGGIIYQTPIEIFDGFEKEYGASIYDAGANILGSALSLSQYLLWQENRIKAKFSFHKTSFPDQRPDILGKSLNEQILKDYNGQTYWLAFNLYSFAKHSGIPKWINFSVGYSANQMVFSRDHENRQAGFTPYRQLFLSFDIDFDHVPIKSKLLKTLLYPLNIIHIPFPAIEFSKQIRFHPIYF